MKIIKVSPTNHSKNHIDFQIASTDFANLQIIFIFPELSPKILQKLFLYYYFTKSILSLNILCKNLNSSIIRAISIHCLQSEIIHFLSIENLDPAPKL